MDRRKFLKGAAGVCAAATLPAAALGLARPAGPFIASGKITFNDKLLQNPTPAVTMEREVGKIAALGFQYGGKVGERLFPVDARIDGFHLEEGERLLITGAANPQANGVYEVTKSSLAEAALKAQPDLYEGIAKELLEPNRLFENIPYVEANKSHLVYDRQVQVVDWRHPSFSVDDEELHSERNRTVEVKNEIKFFDENCKELPFPRMGVTVQEDLTVTRIEELLAKADRPENSFFPRSRARFVPAPKENEYV